MDVVELLQTLGLTKYEAEAYTGLLREGPLTGYELGKRSAVPLPRIYDVLKRLVDRGLVLTRPGDPPRYRAADPTLFLDQIRSIMTQTLDTVTQLLADLPGDERLDDVWIVQTRTGILAHATSLIRSGRSSALLIRASPAEDVDQLIELARAVHDGSAGIRHEPSSGPEQLALLIDGPQALLGTISPPDRCQAIVSAHPALVAAVRAYTGRESGVELLPQTPTRTSRETQPRQWLAWEEEKQRRLLQFRRSVA